MKFPPGSVNIFQLFDEPKRRRAKCAPQSFGKWNITNLKKLFDVYCKLYNEQSALIQQSLDSKVFEQVLPRLTRIAFVSMSPMAFFVPLQLSFGKTVEDGQFLAMEMERYPCSRHLINILKPIGRVNKNLEHLSATHVNLGFLRRPETELDIVNVHLR
jgi:hypothetical protein